MGSSQSAESGSSGASNSVPESRGKDHPIDSGVQSDPNFVGEPQVGKMTKPEALAYCNDLHRKLLDCQLNQSVFSLNSCVKVSNDFWSCIEEARGNTGDRKRSGMAFHEELIPDSVADASAQFRQKMNSVFSNNDIGRSSTFERRREEAIRRNQRRYEAHREEGGKKKE